jgi:hypothetical protein
MPRYMVTSEMSSQLTITNMTKNGIVVTRIDNVTEVSGNPALLEQISSHHQKWPAIIL